ncbi:MAG TPA: insulinase family protein [Chitinophagaceae bacterium]|nr:insulinase family protein [Chitinophagaceae bacterium]
MKLKSLFFLWLVIGHSLAISAQSKYQWKEATSGGYTYKYVTNDPMATRFYTLKNGLSVILSPNKKEPRIAVRIAVRAGSNTDPRTNTGLAHYLEHLLFKGTDKFGSLDWAKEKPLLDSIDNLYEVYNQTTDPAKRKELYKEIDRVSGKAAKYSIAGEYGKLMTSIGSQRTNAHTSVEETVYEEDIPSNAIDKFLTIQAERFRNPILRIFHTELEAVYEEKNRTLDNDGRKVLYAMLENIFPTHNYGQQTTIGTIEHLKNPSLKAIREYYHKYYVPNNMAVIMSGDLNPDELVKKIDVSFSYMQPKPVQLYNGPKEAPIQGPIVKEVFGPSSESVRINYRTGPSDTRNAMLADIVSSVLYNGKAGLMDLNLNKQQKVQTTGAANYQFKDYGIVLLDGQPKQGQTLDEVKDLMLGQINLLKKGEFDESLIKAIAANNKFNQLQGLDNNTGRADNLMNAFIQNKGLAWDNEVGLLDAMSRVTKKEIVDFANNTFTDNNYVVVYKRKGEDKSLVKVEKPPITPVETNAGKESPFLKNIVSTPLPIIKPVWIDYSKDLQRSKMGNADVLYVQNKENDLFRLSYRFDMGSWNNKLLSFAAGYLQFLGTDKYSAEEISKQFYNLACNFTVNAGNEETTITINGLQENFDKAVALFEHLIRNCKPDASALEGLKNRSLRTRANNKLNKTFISQAQRSYAAYGPQNPFNFVLTDDEVKNLKAEELTNLLHSLMNYSHKVLYYGPKPLPALTANLQKLHTLPQSWTANTQGVKFKRIPQTKNEVLFTDYDAVQSEIYWVKNLNTYTPKDEALVNLFNGYFGDIVFQTIRESKALAYSTFAQVVTPIKKDDSYSIIAYVGSQADKMNEAVAGMNELLITIPKEDQDFINARKGLQKDIETDRITKDGIITSYLNAVRKGVDRDLRKDNYALYSNITLNDLVRYHQEQLANKPYTYTVVASEKRINVDDLKKYGEVKKLSLQELFGY